LRSRRRDGAAPPVSHPGDGGHLHRRPAGLLALTAPDRRGGRLRRRRAVHDGAGRRPARRGGDRDAGRADLPKALHGRRDPQLLLEGPARGGGEMSARGISDRVAIVAMGCTRFGEHWSSSADDLMIDAVRECLSAVPGMELADVEAYWLGTLGSGQSGLTLSRALAVDYRPVTRVENYCATGSEAFRNACYAVASGAYDKVMAVGVEKLKDSGFSGLTRSDPPGDGTAPENSLTAPAAFSLLDPAYCAKYGVDPADMRAAMTHVAWKNHANGALNPKAQFRSGVSKEKIDAAPLVAGRLGVYDCSGVSDGAACALIVRAEDAHLYTDHPVYVKALALSAAPGRAAMDTGYDYTTFPEVVRSAEEAYRQAGITDPRRQISMAEVHDCFTPTELVLMEDLGFAR